MAANGLTTLSLDKIESSDITSSLSDGFLYVKIKDVSIAKKYHFQLKVSLSSRFIFVTDLVLNVVVDPCLSAL